MQEKNIIVFGATSAIAQEVCLCLAKENYNFILVARDKAKLEKVFEQVSAITNGFSDSFCFDFLDHKEIDKVVTQAKDKFKNNFILFIAHGFLEDKNSLEMSQWLKSIEINFTSITIIILKFLELLKERPKSQVAIISSVAGLRGKSKNLIYSASKSAINTFIEGLRNRLHPFDVTVTDLRIGTINTPMTKYSNNKFLIKEPADIAQSIISSIRNRKYIAYIPWQWFYIMSVIRILPEYFYKRIKW